MTLRALKANKSKLLTGRFLAIDPSSGAMNRYVGERSQAGWAIFAGGQLESSGIITIDGSNKTERLQDLARTLTNEFNETFDLLVMEDIWGRMASKTLVHACIDGEALVDTGSAVKRLKDIESIQGKPVTVWSTGIKQTILVSLNNGVSIPCTPDHVFFTSDGREVEARNLLGETIDYSPFINVSGKKVLSYIDAFVAGWLLNDGTVRKEGINCAYFTPRKDDEAREIFLAWAKNHKIRVWFDKSRKDKVYFGDEGVPTYLFNDRYVKDKRLPDFFWSLNRESQKQYMRGLFSANGYAVTTRRVVGIKLTSHLLISDIALWLNAIGIDTGCNYRREATSVIRGESVNSRCAAELYLSNFDSYCRFRDTIGFEQQYKQDTVNAFIDRGISRRSTSRGPVKVLKIQEYKEMEVFDFNEPTESCGRVSGIRVHNCGVFIGNTFAKDTIEVNVRRWQAVASRLDCWEKTDENDAIFIGVASMCYACGYNASKLKKMPAQVEYLRQLAIEHNGWGVPEIQQHWSTNATNDTTVED